MIDRRRTADNSPKLSVEQTRPPRARPILPPRPTAGSAEGAPRRRARGLVRVTHRPRLNGWGGRPDVVVWLNPSRIESVWPDRDHGGALVCMLGGGEDVIRARERPATVARRVAEALGR
jgi:hypothetical protein